MATHRENGGFHIDSLARLVRKTALNECLALPVAAAVTWLAQPSSSAYLRKFLALASSAGIDLSNLNLVHIARVALYLGGTGLALSAHDFLNKWASNNWTRSAAAEWSDWSREIVVVTGASSGIGENIVKRLLARNPKTKIVMIDFAPLSWTPSAGMLGANLHYYQADLSKPEQIRSVCERVRREVGHPTVLVNNAGLARGFSIMDAKYSDIEITLKTNLIAPFLLVKEFLGEMVKRNHGHIVNVCSASAIVPPPEIVDYAASKAGIQAFYEGLCMELKHQYDAQRVRVTNCVFNFIKTPLLRQSHKPAQPQFLVPLLHVQTVSETIVNQLYSGYGGVIYLPGLIRYIASLRGGPDWLFRTSIWKMTSDVKVDFKGRQNLDETGELQAEK
ncbi:hypothetical protein VTI74DRAFT_10542 [Chaetomium olivicolor]